LTFELCIAFEFGKLLKDENRIKKIYVKINRTCETSSSSVVGGSLPLFTIFVLVLIVDDEWN